MVFNDAQGLSISQRHPPALLDKQPAEDSLPAEDSQHEEASQSDEEGQPEEPKKKET